MKFRIRHADRIVGLFVILAAAMVAVLVVVLGANQRWFARDYRYRSRFPSASGLSAGTPILFKGFQIGRIESVVLNGQDQVDVQFAVYDTYVDRVKENSILELVTSPIGLGSQLLFHPGSGPTAAPEGSFVPSYDTEEGRSLVERGLVVRPPKDDTITRLLANVNPLVENVSSTVAELERTLGLVNGALAGTGGGPVARVVTDASAAVEGVKDLVAGANATLGSTGARVDRITAELEASLPATLGQVDSAVSSIVAMTANLKSLSDSLTDPTGLVPKLLDPKGSVATLLNDGNRLFDRVDASLASTQGALANLESATAAFADQMPRIVAVIEEARAAIVQAEDVMEGLKNNPLIRGGVSERVQSTPSASPTRDLDF